MAQYYGGLSGITDPDTTNKRVKGEFPVDSFSYGAFDPADEQGGFYEGGRISVSSFTLDFGDASNALRTYILENGSGGSGTGTVDVDEVKSDGSIVHTEFTDTYVEELYETSDDLLASFAFNTVTITYVPPPCFVPGTLIITDLGEKLIESLAIGDNIVTCYGEHRPIRWIGRRTYAGRFLRNNPAVQPIRFHAGSLGGGLPHRDLLVSPNHAMFLDGVLVPARCLVNGSTIVQERGLKQVEYFHIELDSHDILLAEGAPSESFVDDDSRSMFHNAVEWEQLYPDRKRMPMVFFAPRVESGPMLDAIRRRLGEVAGRVVQAA